MTSCRVGRNRSGDRVQIMIENERGVMVGYLLTDEEARTLADVILRNVRPTAKELSSDNSTEP